MKRLPILLAALLLPLGQPRAQNRALDRAFPDSSFAVARFAGLDRCQSAAGAMKVFELGRRTLHKAGLLPAKIGAGDIERAVHELQAHLHEIGFDSASLHALLRGEIAVGIGRPTMFAGTDVAGMIPSFALALDTRGRERDVARALDKAERIIARHAPRASFEWGSERHEQVAVRTLHSKRFGVTIAYAQVDGALLVATGTGYLRDCLRAFRGKTKSIDRNPAYARGRSLVQVEPLVSFFVNTAPLCRILEPMLPYEAPRIGKALGVEGLDGIYWASGTDAHGARDVVFVACRGNEKGLLKSLLSARNSHDAARLCSADTVLFATASLDPKAVMSACRELMRFLPGDARRELEREWDREVVRELERELRHAGMDVHQLHELLHLFGSELSVAVTMPTDRGPLPGITGFVKLRDPRHAREVLLTHLRRLCDGEHGPRLRTRKSNGHEIHFVSVRAGVQLTPCFTIVGDTLAFSPVRIELERLLAGLAENQPRLADTEEFRRTLRECGPSSLFVHARIGKALGLGWDLARSPLDGWLRRNAPDRLGDDFLPTTGEMEEAFGNVTLSCIADEHGYVLQQRHPVGLGTMIALGGWGADWFLRKASGKLD